MKKIIWILVVFSILFSQVAYAKPNISSEAAILMDAETGQILYSKNADERLYPASITKILTAYIVCEKANFNDVITVSKTAIDVVPKDTSNIALDYGEKITVEDALNACMLMSANDAANVLAEYVSGSLEEFAILMNKTANEIGVKKSNFVNANGLQDENHYTTALDFALITKKALENERFLELLSNQEYTISKTNKKDEERNFVTQHRMMHWPQYADLKVVGGKSGYTSQAMYTLVTYGEKNNKKLISVVLKSQTFNEVYQDTRLLLEHGYNDYNRVEVSKENIKPYVNGRVTLSPKGSVTFLLDNKYTINDLKYIYTEDEKINISLPDNTVLETLDTDKTVEPLLIVKILKYIGIILGCILLILIIALILFMKQEKEKKKKRDRKKKLLYK